MMIKVFDKEFKAVPGYEGYYVSKDAKVYSNKSHKIIRTYEHLGCYEYVVAMLFIDGKTRNVPLHKMVALAWCPLPEGFTTEEVLGNYISRNLIIDHIDGNKHNNDASNLRWCTTYENLNFDNVHRNAEKLKGNKNACGRKSAISKAYRYLYILDGKQYTLRELTKELNCSNSKITESFRRNLGLVKQGRLTRIINK